MHACIYIYYINIIIYIYYNPFVCTCIRTCTSLSSPPGLSVISSSDPRRRCNRCGECPAFVPCLYIYMYIYISIITVYINSTLQYPPGFAGLQGCPQRTAWNRLPCWAKSSLQNYSCIRHACLTTRFHLGPESRYMHMPLAHLHVPKFKSMHARVACIKSWSHITASCKHKQDMGGRTAATELVLGYERLLDHWPAPRYTQLESKWYRENVLDIYN